MNTRRIVVALLSALLISGLCTFVLARRVMRHAAGRPQTQPYVTVNKPVLPGEVLKAENLVADRLAGEPGTARRFSPH